MQLVLFWNPDSIEETLEFPVPACVRSPEFVREAYFRFCIALPMGVNRIPAPTPMIHTYFQLIRNPVNMMAAVTNTQKTN